MLSFHLPYSIFTIPVLLKPEINPLLKTKISSATLSERVIGGMTHLCLSSLFWRSFLFGPTTGLFTFNSRQGVIPLPFLPGVLRCCTNRSFEGSGECVRSARRAGCSGGTGGTGSIFPRKAVGLAITSSITSVIDASASSRSSEAD